MRRVRKVLSLTLAAMALLITGASADVAELPHARATMPEFYQINMMIRGTVIALHHANVSGNYSVLRDLAAPEFQRANNPARLAEIFAAMRAKPADLSPAYFVNPVLIRDPAIDPQGLLRLSGFFPSRGRQLTFDMIFQFNDGQWQVLGLNIDVRTAPVEAPIPPQASLAAQFTPPPSGAAPVSKKSDRDRMPPATGPAFIKAAPAPESADRAAGDRARTVAAKPGEIPGTVAAWKTEPEKLKPEPSAVTPVRIDFSNLR